MKKSPAMKSIQMTPPIPLCQPALSPLRGLSHQPFPLQSQGNRLALRCYTPSRRASIPHSACALFSGGISVRSMPRARLRLNYKA